MKKEIRSSKDELQLLQVERQVRETTQECLERVQREYQELRVEKEQLLGKIGDLEQSKKSSAQLKDTLRKEREESNKLKRKYEDMKKEIRSSKDELQLLQAEKQVRENTQESLERV